MGPKGASRVLVLAGLGVLASAEGVTRGQEHQGQRGADSIILESSPATSRLVEALSNPAKPSEGADRLGLYLMDLASGDVTLIADTPQPGLTQCGSPAWSTDGKIYFDATPGTQWNLTRLMVIELADDKLKLADLGPGNCPVPSPSSDRVMFLQNAGPVPDTEAGVWIMQSDGTDRRKLGGYGRPFWSPDGHQFLVVSFSSPRELTVIDDRPGRKSGVLKVPEYNIYTMPSWAGVETIVAVIGADAPDTIALLDVADPQDGKIKKFLWRKPADSGLKLNYPVSSPRSGTCFFVGADDKGMAVYSVEPGKPEPPKKLERDADDKHISGLVLSRDGRYLLFSGDRTARK